MLSNHRESRLGAGITVAALAKKADLSPTTLARVERGRRAAPTTLSKIAIAFNDLAPNGHAKTREELFPDA